MMEQYKHWLALSHLPINNHAHIIKLLRDYKFPEIIFDLGRKKLTEHGLALPVIERILRPRWTEIEKDLDWIEQSGTKLVTYNEQSYPKLLRKIYDPPPVLYVQGVIDILNSLQIAIVGSRKSTPDGKRYAREFAAGLCNHGITITSGLAYGVDTFAHKGAIEKDGRTIAVLGNGLKTIYPAANRNLAVDISERGALVSEFPPGYRPRPHNFPVRNRIISGLCVGVLVVEAASKSGSLITATHAVNQGREVFAIPGAIRNPLTQGCHDLIKNGAKLVEKIPDILEEIDSLASVVVTGFTNAGCNGDKILGLDEEAKLLLDNIGYQPITVDTLIEATGFSVSKISDLLLKLELEGHIETLPGGSLARK